jgi:hypothetical protein
MVESMGAIEVRYMRMQTKQGEQRAETGGSIAFAACKHNTTGPRAEKRLTTREGRTAGEAVAILRRGRGTAEVVAVGTL